MGRTALVILVPEAEPLVADHRLVHDPMARHGVPAHVTVLYPFRPIVDDDTAETVGRLMAGVDQFEATFATVGRFPGDVVFLEPEPQERFKQLTRALAEAFPDCPPYGGEFPDPHPHLTVGVSLDAESADLLADDLMPGLPVRTRVDRLTQLTEDDDGTWTATASWPMSPSPQA